MEKYIKTIEILEERVIDLEKALKAERERTSIWYGEYQELKKKYEPESE